MSALTQPGSALKKDLLAGLIVFLIALPLCLGIAQTSGAPLFSGIVAGVVGGIVVGFASKSGLSVSGPAAGLTAIVLVAIAELGGFSIFLCAVFFAGIFQLILGYLKAGGIASYFPSNVIEGMLAGIGLTIIIKQLPEAVGFDKGHFALMTDADDGFQWSDIQLAFQHISPVAVIIAVIGLAILILWQTKWLKKVRLIPAGLLVVIVGTIINEVFVAQQSPLLLDSTRLVNMHVPISMGDFFSQFAFPDFKSLADWHVLSKVLKTAGVIAVVASIETLLSVEATDKLDPQKRFTPANAELRAQGLGNIFSSLLGGLPMTSVIVRSSANINAGGRTKRSAITHGILLLICVAAIPGLLNHIPKAALAAILLYTGYRLCKPSVFRHMWKEGGLTQFIPFAATAFSVYWFNLLEGVGIGLAISIFFMLRQNMRIPYYFQRSSFSRGELIKLKLAQEVSFLNKGSIKETLFNLPSNSSVIIDASATEYIDFDVLDLLREFQNVQAKDRNIRLSLLGFRNTYNVPTGEDEWQVASGLVQHNEVPKRSAGNYKKLLRQLSGGKKGTV